MKMESRSRALDKLYKRRDHFEFPGWQREKVWRADRQRLLIDTIFQGWHLPKYYFVKVNDAPDQYEVVDGQERLAAIWAFQDGTLALSDESSREFGGKTYRELPPDVSDRFDDFEIQFEEISGATDEELTGLFQRLQMGVGLTPDERLNAVLGDLRDFCWDMARHKFFAEKVLISEKRYAHFGVSVRFAFLEIEGISSQLRLPQLEQLLRDHAAFSTTSNAARRMREALEFLDVAFPERSSALRNRSAVLALLRLSGRLVDSGVTLKRATEVGRYFENFAASVRKEVEKGPAARDADLLAYQASITSNLTSGSVIRIREGILLKWLVLHDPTFAEQLMGPIGIGPALVEDVNNEAAEIESLIEKVNEAYAGRNGSDLFKATNKIIGALARLPNVVRSRADYGDLIDDLYFLVFESTGGGKRYLSGMPEFADDIRSLRTQMRHDVDHGKKGKAAKKRRELGSVFRKFGSTDSPDVLTAEAFPAVQMNLLKACREMMEDIAEELAIPGGS